MIRPKWPRQAVLHQWRGLSSKPPPRRARPSKNRPPSRGPPSRGPRPEWPQLKRRAPQHSAGTLHDDPDSDAALAAALRRKAPTKDEFAAMRGVSRGLGRSEVDWTALATEASKIREGPGRAALPWEKAPRAIKDEARGKGVAGAASSSSNNRNMLLVRGVSNNLTASDFYRLAPNSLSSWESSIKKGQSPSQNIKKHPANTPSSPAAARPQDPRAPRLLPSLVRHRLGRRLVPRQLHPTAAPRAPQDLPR